MTWKADRLAFTNVMRAMRTPHITDYIHQMNGAELPVVPAVASDRFSTIREHFADGRGVVIFTRSENLVDVFVFERVGAPELDSLMPDITMGELVEMSDRANTDPFATEPTNHQQFSLAA